MFINHFFNYVPLANRLTCKHLLLLFLKIFSIFLIFYFLMLFWSAYILFIYVCMYVCMAVLGLRFCARAFSSCGKRGPLFIAVRGPLCIAVRGPLAVAASLVAEHRLQTRRLSNCGSRAELLRGMWDLRRPGLEPASPALAGRFSTTAPPGKPCFFFFMCLHSKHF